MIFETALTLETGTVSGDPLRIYSGILGQIGDIIMFTATARRIKELFPRSEVTFAVSARYRQAGELVAGLPYVDHLFVTQLYFERLTDPVYGPWHMGWPVDLRGEDEIVEQRRHDVVLETRPRHRRARWWEFDHQVAECAHQISVPGPIDLRTEVCIPPGTRLTEEAIGKVVIHNDASIDGRKAWPWPYLEQFVRRIGPERVALLGNPGPPLAGTLDLRGRTTLAEAAAVIGAAQCYVGIDSGLMWIAGSLQIPVIGLYGTCYLPAYGAIQPRNPRALYLQAEGTLDRISVGRVLECYEQLVSTPDCMLVPRNDPMTLLQRLFEQALTTPSDIQEHLGALYELARTCDHVTEMGTRRGWSTRAFLYAQPSVLVCYDLVREPDVDLLEEAARQAGRPRFEFHQANVLQVEIEETDLLFIDTLHVYDQMKQELALHARKARKHLVFHDTTTFGEVGEVEGSRGIWPAIEEFLRENRDWRLGARLTHNNGLTVLHREARSVRRESRGRACQAGSLATSLSPNVAIVVPVHNALEYCRGLLTTIALTARHVPLIVVDDHSDAAAREWLTGFLFEEWPGERNQYRALLRNERQQLFTRAVNRGIRWADTLRSGNARAPIDFVAVVNTDCELQEPWLQVLLWGMERPEVGLVGFAEPADGLEPAYREMQEPDYIEGHCILLRMAMLAQIGVFWETDTQGSADSPGLERYLGQAHVGSDRALSWRANRAGWKTLYCHYLLCHHLGAASWHRNLQWLSGFPLIPLWPPCDELENPG